jgi:hypothetical protein
VRPQGLAGDALVLAQHVAAACVTKSLHHRGVADDVRKEDRAEPTRHARVG